MSRILVTGANGQLGKSIQEIAKNAKDLHYIFKSSKELDITDSLQVNSILSYQSFDYCINCAAYTNVENAERNPEVAHRVNALGVANIAHACSKNEVILIHISTDYVFDGRKEGPYTINDPTNPINMYGKSKLKGEEYIQAILKEFFIIRTSWLYSQYGNNFYKTILEKAKEGIDLKITDEQTGCPTKASNLAGFISKLIVAKSEAYGIHHFTDGIAMSWFDFAQKIIDDNGLEGSVHLEKVKNYRTFAQRPKNSVLE